MTIVATLQAADPSRPRRGGRSSPVAQGGGGIDVAAWPAEPHPLSLPSDPTRRLQSLYEAEVRERVRIARELHDVVGQALTAVRISMMLARSTADPTQRDERLATGLDLIDAALNDVRAIAYDLRPSELDDMGLPAAVRWYLARHERTSGVRIGLRSSAAVVHDRGVETAAYRIIQEAVTNTLRHASASRIVVGLRQHDAELLVEIRDDGIGFDAREAFASPASIGLRGMCERAQLVGGSLEINSASGRGTRVCARLPGRPRP